MDAFGIDAMPAGIYEFEFVVADGEGLIGMQLFLHGPTGTRDLTNGLATMTAPSRATRHSVSVTNLHGLTAADYTVNATLVTPFN